MSRKRNYDGWRDTPVWKHWGRFWAWTALWCFLMWVALLHYGNYEIFWGSQLLWGVYCLFAFVKAPGKDWSSTDTVLFRTGLVAATWFFGSRGWIDEIVIGYLFIMGFPLAFYGLACCWLMLPRVLTRPVEDFFGPEKKRAR